MKLYMKQKIFSWNDRFLIGDEEGRECYRVEGELFSWGHKLHIYDVGGQEVAFLQQKLMSWLPTYLIYQGETQVAQITKKLTFLQPRYILEGLGWEIEGDAWAHDYRIVQDGVTVAELHKEWFTWGDSYALEIVRPEDAVLALCVALVVDCVLDAND